MTVALYRHYDSGGALLYVGISGRPVRRTATHVASAEWRSRINRIQIEQFPWRWLAEAAEKTAIMTERPLFNVTHNQSRGEQSSKAEDSAAEPKGNDAGGAARPLTTSNQTAGVAPGPRELPVRRKGRPLDLKKHLTYEALKPWVDEGVSKRTWYRRRAEARK